MPHPYLFWATVGGTLLVQSFATGGIAASAAFVVSLYAFLVGAKLSIAFLLSRSQGWLKGRTYHAMLVGSGLLLIGLGLLLIWEGVQHFLIGVALVRFITTPFSCTCSPPVHKPR